MYVKHLGNTKRNETSAGLFREKLNTINSKLCYPKAPGKTSREMGVLQAVEVGNKRPGGRSHRPHSGNSTARAGSAVWGTMSVPYSVAP